MANTPQSYAVKFRSLTPEKLAEIIAREDDYHADAVTAARLELTARMLSAEELDRIYDLAEQQKAKSGSDGTRLGIGANPRIEAARNAIKEKTKSSIWGRTNILKLIFVYLLLSLSYVLFSFFADIYYFSSGFSIHTLFYLAPQIIAALFYIIPLGLGLKGYKAAW